MTEHLGKESSSQREEPLQRPSGGVCLSGAGTERIGGEQ